MGFIKIVIHGNASKRNKARLRAQPDLKNLFNGDWGKSPQRAKLYKSTLFANLDKVVKVVLASGIKVMLEAFFYYAIFYDKIIDDVYNLSYNILC